jgi:AraC-like DNA-binding protein
VLGTHDEFLSNDPRQVVETILIGIVHQLRLLTNRHVVPMSLAMRHPRPRSGEREHERLFGTRPRFGAEVDEVVIANVDLDVPLRSANQALLAAFDSHAEAALAALARQDTMASRTSAEIIAALKGEAPSIGVVARALAMSPRTLQRGLAAEGTSFQSLLDVVRRELAIRHLAAPDATVAKVAWLVGFAEPGAFHRAFRRWTGQTPKAAA